MPARRECLTDAELVARAQNQGSLSLSLRPLSDDAVASNAPDAVVLAPRHASTDPCSGNGSEDESAEAGANDEGYDEQA